MDLVESLCNGGLSADELDLDFGDLGDLSGSEGEGAGAKQSGSVGFVGPCCSGGESPKAVSSAFPEAGEGEGADADGLCYTYEYGCETLCNELCAAVAMAEGSPESEPSPETAPSLSPEPTGSGTDTVTPETSKRQRGPLPAMAASLASAAAPAPIPVPCSSAPPQTLVGALHLQPVGAWPLSAPLSAPLPPPPVPLPANGLMV